MYRAQAHIDLSALQHNLAQIKILAPAQKVLAMIKSNGYGHGILPVAKALSQADAFGVACLPEALKLQEAHINKPIVLLSGVLDSAELQLAAQHQFQLVVHEKFQIELLQQAKLLRPLIVWLKIDTGMHRLGFSPEQFLDAYQQLKNCPNVKHIILMTHLANADLPKHASITQQLKLFATLTADLTEAKSIVNSAGIMALPNAHAQWIRPGISLYGVSPFAEAIATKLALKPVMTMTAPVIAVHQLRKGDAVGYGSTWVCPEEMSIAVLGIGYGDGYPRQMQNGAPVLLNGVRCALAGRVSMDMITIDIRGCTNVKIGDQATLWGKDLPAEEVAPYANTIAYTLFCGLTQRVLYTYQ
jgi:alanine racemase